MKEIRFSTSIEDVIIAPLVLVALAVRNFLHLVSSTLIHIVDYAFPIFLGLMRLPLFSARIFGDGLIETLKLIIICLPVSPVRRIHWREAAVGWWRWLRQKLSYKAFEEAVHHAFENGMAWVFRKCRNLTPRGALITIAGAVLWLPVSFGAATVMHAVLIAKAASLPAWMQLLHPLATLIAKSKLLVLPVYPAAWPQAKKHASIQEIFRLNRAFFRLYLVRKTAYRYRQTANAVAGLTHVLGRAASLVGLSRFFRGVVSALNRMVGWVGEIVRAAMARTAENFSTIPLIGALLRRYAAQHEGTKPLCEEKFSERVRIFFLRWSIKFSAEYYEAKERKQVPQHQTLTQTETKGS
ncbi:MAG: hypothetical protein P8Y67_13615 [Alphaproteobacteria bacterium]